MLFGIVLAPILKELSLKLAALEVLSVPAPQDRLLSIPEHHDPISDAVFADGTPLGSSESVSATQSLVDGVQCIDSAFKTLALSPNYASQISHHFAMPWSTLQSTSESPAYRWESQVANCRHAFIYRHRPA